MSLISNKKTQPRKPLKKKELTEHQIQTYCVRWFRNNYPKCVIYAVANEATKSRFEYYKAAGVLPGVADLCVLLPSRSLYIEMKRKDGYQKDSQKEFQKKIEAMGYKYFICRSLDEFKQIISDNI